MFKNLPTVTLFINNLIFKMYVVFGHIWLHKKCKNFSRIPSRKINETTSDWSTSSLSMSFVFGAHMLIFLRNYKFSSNLPMLFSKSMSQETKTFFFLLALLVMFEMLLLGWTYKRVICVKNNASCLSCRAKKKRPVRQALTILQCIGIAYLIKMNTVHGVIENGYAISDQ